MESKEVNIEGIPDDPILILGGGGMRGIGHAGVIRVFEKKGVMEKIRHFAGASIGGFICMLWCLGYKSSQIENIMINTPFRKIIEGMSIETLIFKSYLSKAEWLDAYLSELIRLKGYDPGSLTFQELYKLNNGKDLIVTAVDKKSGRVFFLSKETFPNVLVKDGIYMTMTVPNVIQPKELFHPVYGQMTMVDGGLLENYPVSVFDHNSVIGVRLGLRDNVDDVDGTHPFPEKPITNPSSEKTVDINNQNESTNNKFDCSYIFETLHFQDNTTEIPLQINPTLPDPLSPIVIKKMRFNNSIGGESIEKESDDILNNMGSSLFNDMKKTLENGLNTIRHVIEKVEERSVEGISFREIEIDTLGVDAFSVSIDINTKVRLLLSGAKAALAFLNNPYPRTPVPKRNTIVFKT